LQKAIAESLDGGRDSRNVGRIKPETDDVRHTRNDTAATR
jgi:hypothetical protein